MTVTNGDAEAEGESLKHHCGVAAAFSPVPARLPESLFYMLFSLQHRGQESAGIAWQDGDGGIAWEKGAGMVSSVLGKFIDSPIETNICIGHTRYSTAGGSGSRNAQPIVVECSKGSIALAHNGNISNSASLRSELTASGAIFQTSSDSELILHLISRSRETGVRAILETELPRLEGAYSLAIIWNGELILARDPHGFRPLYVSEQNGTVFAASETCAILHGGAAAYREIAPGEVATYGKDGSDSFSLPSRRISPCVFELIYFARPDSEVYGRSVYSFRKELGRELARGDSEGLLAGKGGRRPDVVIPVPDSGVISAIGYAEESGIPFGYGLARNHYAGRTFIMPTKGQREHAVRLKLHPVREVVRGKSVVMIDDSLVRGTTSRIIVRLLKEAGAAAVHVRLASPEVHHPCYFGIDIPTRDELISNRHDLEGIRQYIGADSVAFLAPASLASVAGEAFPYCAACFDGDYPCAHEGNRNG